MRMVASSFLPGCGLKSRPEGAPVRLAAGTVPFVVDALMVTSSFLPGRGGIESYLSELCSLVAPRVAVMAPPERDGIPLPRDLTYPTVPGPTSMLWPGRKIAHAVVREARALGTDRVVLGTPWPLVLIGPRLRAAGLRYSVIVHGAELVFPGAVPGLHRSVGRALGMAELLLPVSDYTGRATAALLHRVGVEVPPMKNLRARVDLDRFRPGLDGTALRAKLGIEADQPVVLCFGRLVPRKGVDWLIAAMPDVAAAVPGAVLVVGGTGRELKKLKRLADKLKAPVVFAGRVADEDAPVLYSTADVFALAVADRWFGLEIEGLGVVLLEASACETPCVTGRSGGTPEAVLDGVTGRVVNARDKKELGRALIELLQNDEMRASMGAAARAHVAANFSAGLPPAPLLEWLG